MAERKRSKDGRQETEDYLDDAPTPTGQGREGGNLARLIGSEDEGKRADERPAGRTRPTKSDEERPGTSNLGEENR